MVEVHAKCVFFFASVSVVLSQKPDENSVSRREFEELKELLRDTRKTMQIFEQQIQDLSAQQVSQSHQNVQADDGFVGFTVYSTSDQSCDSNERVDFQGVITNFGSGFDTSISQFVCPVNGYYLFSTTVVNVEEHRVSTDIMMGGTRVGHAYARNPQDCNQGASTGIVYCSQGTSVHVLCGGEDRTRGDISTPYTSFTGVLLRITP